MSFPTRLLSPGEWGLESGFLSVLLESCVILSGKMRINTYSRNACTLCAVSPPHGDGVVRVR